MSWPKEYTEFATHPTQTAIARSLTTGQGKTIQNKAVQLNVAVVAPTDIDDEFGDGAQNAYKIIKSLTSGARFYTETTGYAYRLTHRSLQVLVARAFGLLQAIKARVNVANAPNFGAYQMLRQLVAENYDAAIEKVPAYEKAILEMISELNSLPTPTLGGSDKFFEYFSHVYKDDKALASDYYAFIPVIIGRFAYSDATKTITGVTTVPINTMTISDIVDEFNSIVADLRDSTDMNNLMADMLNTLPSSRYDWMGKLREHADFVRDVTPKLLTAVGSATMPLSNITFGTLDAAGKKVEFLESNFAGSPNDFHKGWQDEVAQFVSTYRGAPEHECFDFILHNENAKPGFTPAGTDKVSTTGLILAGGSYITAFGTPASAPSFRGFNAAYTDSNSAIQTTAEEGGKALALVYINFAALPKLDMFNFGNNGPENMYWRKEDLKICPVADILNNVKAINMIAFSTVHLTTERQR